MDPGSLSERHPNACLNVCATPAARQGVRRSGRAAPCAARTAAGEVEVDGRSHPAGAIRREKLPKVQWRR